METLIRSTLVISVLAGCGDLVGFGGEVPPLTTLQVELTGDLESVRTADGEQLRIAVVWGTQWLAEPTCTTLPDTVELGELMLAGCRNPFAFTPVRASASAPIEIGVPLEMPINDLPGADVMVGTLSGRVGYGSLVVFDDRDGNELLSLSRTQRPPMGDPVGPDDADPDPTVVDIVYAASFVAMTEPDTRLAFREGSFNLAAAFYPRTGCGEPLQRFSVLSAGGFSLLEAYNASQEGRLPQQDPATCSELAPDAATISIALRAPADITEVACRQFTHDGSIRFRQPPIEPVDLSDRTFLCRKVPETEIDELVVSGRDSDPCNGLTHYVLRGCDDSEDVACELPEWDYTENPPAWWPCTEVTP